MPGAYKGIAWLEGLITLQGNQPDKYGLRPISDMDVSTWEVILPTPTLDYVSPIHIVSIQVFKANLG